MGISHIVVQNFAPHTDLCKPMNEYAEKLATEYDGFLFQYGADHPDNPPEDLIKLKKSGLFYGVKLYPYTALSGVLPVFLPVTAFLY